MNPLLGSIMLWPFDWAPQSWLLCNGQSLSIKQNSALHSLMYCVIVVAVIRDPFPSTFFHSISVLLMLSFDALTNDF